MATPVLEVHNLGRAVTQDGRVKSIVDDISYNFFPDKIYTIIGPSGSGKSSLLRLLNRLDEPTSGEVVFHGKDHCDYPPCELRQKIGYLFQTPYLFEGTVRDNLLYATKNLSDESIKLLLEQAQLKPEQLDRPTDNFSGGEKQRVAIARLLATCPEVVLLDEPTSALDPSYTEAIEKLIVDIVAKGKLTAIVVTHSPEQALRIGKEALLMVDGKLVETGEINQVINEPQSELGKLYKQRQLK
ncbi:MAG: ATP-binding cassette domain-containing protein [Candidatus Zixiibacteriota bacterium]|nr:MAG: ATP-binding cassette domain-containing protein [candidate division Zixibacteria bacterium]